MGKEILSFDNIESEKKNFFTAIKVVFFSKDLDIENVLVILVESII